MRSNNPVFTRSEEFNRASSNAYGNQTYAGGGASYPGYGETDTGTPQVDQGRMTVDSVVQKTAISIALVFVTAAATWWWTGDMTTTDSFGNTVVDENNLAQASLLAGLVQAPSAYDPLVHLSLARARQHYVIDRLAATGISPARARAAQIAPLQLHSGGTAGALGSRSAWGEQAATSPGRVVSRAATCVADWRLGKVTSGRNDVAGHRRRSW